MTRSIQARGLQKGISYPTIAILGSKSFIESWGAKIESAGFSVRAFESIRLKRLDTRPLDRALRSIDDYTDLIFTSGTAASIFVERCRALGVTKSTFASLKVYCVGASTAAELSPLVAPRRVILPGEQSAKGLAKTIGTSRGRRFLHPRAELAADALDRKLKSNLHAIPVYRTAPGRFGGFFTLAARKKLFVVVGSGASATFMIEEMKRRNLKFGTLFCDAAFIAIGPATRRELRRLGVDAAMLPEPTPRALEGLLRKMGKGATRRLSTTSGG